MCASWTKSHHLPKPQNLNKVILQLLAAFVLGYDVRIITCHSLATLNFVFSGMLGS